VRIGGVIVLGLALLAASVLAGLAPIVGPLVAALGALSWWRVQTLGKRKSEVAEEALVLFAGAIDAVRAIRNPGVPPAVGETPCCRLCGEGRG
jgi:hypothetical protein